jgi:hypothetical protein
MRSVLFVVLLLFIALCVLGAALEAWLWWLTGQRSEPGDADQDSGTPPRFIRENGEQPASRHELQAKEADSGARKRRSKSRRWRFRSLL